MKHILLILSLLLAAPPALAQQPCHLGNAILAGACFAEADSACRAQGQAMVTGSVIAGAVVETGCAAPETPVAGITDCAPGRDCACSGGAAPVPGGGYTCGAAMMAGCLREGGTMVLRFALQGAEVSAWGHCAAG